MRARHLFAVAAVVVVMIAVLMRLDPGAAGPRIRPEHEPGHYPSDWFGMQRAYPGDVIPQDAYLAAREQAIFEREAQALATSGMNWTQAGPYNIGGRVTALAVVPGGTTIYLGAANGGVFKSVNSGVNWTPIFDQPNTSVFSLGALALDPNNSNVLWVGTGEANAANDSYDGYGVWRTTNGGTNWAYMGLGETKRIGRVAVDPSNSNRIFVAGMGTQYSTNPDRGLYRSENGGASWTKVLFVNDSTGCIDVVINPAHPDTVYAATWERVRHNTYRRAFGPGCRIWRSIDFGTTWTALATGLPVPSDNVGRIGLAIAPSRPSTVYAQIISGSAGGYTGLGLYRTLDGGNTWTKRDADVADFTNAFGGFGWYFGEMAVDPTNPDKIYCLGQLASRSFDGGINFGVIIDGSQPNTHVDLHAIWIDPSNPNVIYIGGDGGFHKSTNGGSIWSRSLDLPITQFYAGAIDPSNANRLLGGTQDNNSLQTTGSPTGWTIMLGGDGFQCMVDPTNPNIVFAEWQYCCGGYGLQRSTNGGASFSGTPVSGVVSGDRWNWNTPIVMDPSDHNVILIASHRVYKSTNNGLGYVPISADLTSNLPTLGLRFSTITTLDISPVANNIYYAGTDDGRVWRSLTSGSGWTEISAGLPLKWITRVKADPVDPGTVYVTLSGFSSDEHDAHVYRSTNNGTTWAPIDGNLPNAPVNDIVADPSDPNTLYLATDLGVFITRNLGGTWYPFGQGMPLQAIFDLKLHQGARKLVAATHGRSQWSINLGGLAVGVEPGTAPARLALSAPAPNPSRGTARFDLELGASGRADVQVFDASGRLVRKLVSGALDAGRHAIAWNGLDEHGAIADAGVYFVRATSGGATDTRRIVRVR